MALYNLDILDTAPTEQFDRVIRLACRLFNVPIALVSFIEDDRQWFKAKRGLCLTETPRVVAFCDWTVRSADVHVVEDASADERFRDNPLVTGDPHIRFYAGAPLSFEGEQVGSVCVIDKLPRSLSREQLATLRDLASITEDLLVLHKTGKEISKKNVALKSANTHLARLAITDELTGLMNRRAFEEELLRRIANAQNDPFALHYIDLDYFKALNDFAGHAAGDEALERIARAIETSLPQQSVAARLGGDEFAVLHSCRDEAHARNIAASLIENIRRSQTGFNRSPHQLSASIGTAINRDSTVAASDIVACADDACYSAKVSGRNRFRVYSGEMAEQSLGLNSARIVGDLLEAMDDGRLQLFGQEIRYVDQPDAWSGRVEVLARLIGRDGRKIPPGVFITAAERFGMAATLDRWIFRTAMEKYGSLVGRWNNLRLGINLSAQSLSDPDFWNFVNEEIARSGASHSHIVFEITETATVTNFDAAQRFVSEARAASCRVSIDDFGTGLSSFDYLRRFPVDTIKIDGSFVSNLIDSRFDREIVKSVKSIADSIGCEVVAEKVEEERTLSVLRSLGITFAQGFWLHRPQPLAEILSEAYSPKLLANQ